MEGLVEDARFLDVALSLKAKENWLGWFLPSAPSISIPSTIPWIGFRVKIK